MADKPRIVLPNQWEYNYGSFIQVYANEQPFFRTGEADFLHRRLLRLFLEEMNLKFKEILDPYEVESPAPKGMNYELVGAGEIEILSENDFNLWCESRSYKIGPNKKHLGDLIPYLPEGVKIRVGEEIYAR